MICNKDTAKKTAKLLLEINTIKLQPNNNFTCYSGWFAPIYCGNRISLSYPKASHFIKKVSVGKVQGNYIDVEVIA